MSYRNYRLRDGTVVKIPVFEAETYPESIIEGKYGGYEGGLTCCKCGRVFLGEPVWDWDEEADALICMPCQIMKSGRAISVYDLWRMTSGEVVMVSGEVQE